MKNPLSKLKFNYVYKLFMAKNTLKSRSRLSNETYMRDKGLTFYIIMLQIRGEWIARWGAVRGVAKLKLILITTFD